MQMRRMREKRGCSSHNIIAVEHSEGQTDEDLPQNGNGNCGDQHGCKFGCGAYGHQNFQQGCLCLALSFLINKITSSTLLEVPKLCLGEMLPCNTAE
eukprot:7089048-Ditylum_brightwellii.AAC.1